MEINKQEAIRQLDAVWDECQRREELVRELGCPASADGYLDAKVKSVIQRLSPPGSIYPNQMRSNNHYIREAAVKALRDDYDNDCLVTFKELVNADLFSDFLAMAEYLVKDENLKQPAAVLAGGVLEEHLRKLCLKYGIAITKNNRPKKTDTMNACLRKAGVYGLNEQKLVAAWCGIRNSAAHARHDEYEASQVDGMISGIRTTIANYPA